MINCLATLLMCNTELFPCYILSNTCLRTLSKPNYVLVVLCSSELGLFTVTKVHSFLGAPVTLGDLKQLKFYLLTVLDAESPKSRSRKDWFLLEALRVSVAWFSPRFWGCQRPLAFSLSCRYITTMSSSHAFSPCLWLFLF